MRSLLTVSALILVTSAAGKTVTYGFSSSDSAKVVVRQATRVPKGLALAAVLAELLVAASLTVARRWWRLRCGLLFLLCCCFLSYRLLTWGEAPCGCFANPALLNSTATKALELFAWASLLYMLLGSALAILSPGPADHPRPATL